MTAKKSAETVEEVPETATHTPHTQTEADPYEADKRILADLERRSRNVYQRLIDANRVIDSMPFAKDMSNSQYKSVPIDVMRAAVRKACIEAGLVHVGPLELDYTAVVKDGRIKVYTGTAVFRYVNVDDPHDWIDYPTLGEAMDTGDKGAGKLVSNLIKTHYKAAFDIGERGKDDIDSYANEDIEAEADRIAERRARRQEAVKGDPFFGKGPSEEVVSLRKRIGRLYAQGGKAASTVDRYKAEHGSFATWPEEVLRECLAECSEEGGQ